MSKLQKTCVIYVTSDFFFENHWIPGTVLGAAGTTNETQRLALRECYSLGLNGTNRRQTIPVSGYVLLSDVPNVGK